MLNLKLFVLLATLCIITESKQYGNFYGFSHRSSSSYRYSYDYSDSSPKFVSSLLAKQSDMHSVIAPPYAGNIPEPSSFGPPPMPPLHPHGFMRGPLEYPSHDQGNYLSGHHEFVNNLRRQIFDGVKASFGHQSGHPDALTTTPHGSPHPHPSQPPPPPPAPSEPVVPKYLNPNYNFPRLENEVYNKRKSWNYDKGYGNQVELDKFGHKVVRNQFAFVNNNGQKQFWSKGPDAPKRVEDAFQTHQNYFQQHKNHRFDHQENHGNYNHDHANTNNNNNHNNNNNVGDVYHQQPLAQFPVPPRNGFSHPVSFYHPEGLLNHHQHQHQNHNEHHFHPMQKMANAYNVFHQNNEASPEGNFVKQYSWDKTQHQPYHEQSVQRHY